MLRTYAELNRIVIRGNLSVPYRIWLLARAADGDGRGIADRPALLDLMQRHGLTPAHLRTARRHDRAGVFFTVYHDRIEYRSLQSVCLSLKTDPGRIVPIDLAAVAGIEDFNAALYAGWFAGQGQGRQISRERLSLLFGVSDVTMRRWERAAGVEVRYNTPRVESERLASAEKVIPRDKRTDGDRLGQTYTWERDGFVYWQTVNTYRAGMGSDGRGVLGNTRKVSKIVRAAVEICGDGANVQRRIFYTKENTPENYQLTPGACYKASGQSVRAVKRFVNGDGTMGQVVGSAAVWLFSEMRPVTRRAVFSGQGV